MRVVANVTNVENHAARQLLLDVEVVLIDIRRAEVRVNQVDAAGGAERLRRGKAGGRVGRGRWERVGSSGIVGAEGIGKITGGARLGPGQRIEIEAGLGVERRGSVELKIVFALKNVIEDSDSTANRGLRVAEDVPCPAETRRPIVLVGEVRSFWRSRVARKDQAGRRIHKALALVAGYKAKGSSLGVVFRFGILIAESEIEGQPSRQVKVVLRIARNLVRPNVAECIGGLKIVIWQAKQKVRQIGSGSNAGRRPIEKEASISIEIIPRVVLIRREVHAEFHIVLTLGPGKVVVVRVNRIKERSWSTRVETGVQASAVERKVWRPGDYVGRDVDPELGRSHFAQRRTRDPLVGIGANRCDPRLIQKSRREDVSVIDIPGISLQGARGRVARHRGVAEGAGEFGVVRAEGGR